MNVLGPIKKRSKEYHAGFEAGRKMGVQQATIVLIMFFVQFLGDKRGWKRERIFDAIIRIQSNAESVSGEWTTFPEVVDAVRKDYGIIYQDGKFCLLSEREWKEGQKDG